MKQNMGVIDRGLRNLAALAIGILYFTNQITGTVGLVLAAFAVMFVLTSSMSFCPLYLPLKISTKRTENKA